MKSKGYSLLEALVAIWLALVVAGAAVPLTYGSVDRSRAAAAASYVASRMAMARFEAVKRSAFVAIRFTQNAEGYWLRAYVDGNGNGVLARDIERGIDHPISSSERLDYHFPGVTFGILPNVTPLDPGGTLDPGDPIQIGSSSLLSFNPNGSTTSGTVFICGRRASQFAVRLLGGTGRARVFQFDFEAAEWRMR